MRGEDQSKETQGQRGARRCREVLHAHLVFVSAVAIKILPHGHITRLALVDDRGGVQRRAALPIARGSRVACSTRGPNAWHQQTEQTADGDDSRGSRRRGQTAWDQQLLRASWVRSCQNVVPESVIEPSPKKLPPTIRVSRSCRMSRQSERRGGEQKE